MMYQNDSESLCNTVKTSSNQLVTIKKNGYVPIFLRSNYATFTDFQSMIHITLY